MVNTIRIKSPLLSMLHLDHTYSLLPAKSVRLLLELFQMLDIHGVMSLNDVQFLVFMRYATDLSQDKIMNAFDMLDFDRSGEMDFDEFYLLACILIAVKDGDEKQFIYHHSRTVFDMMDEDGSNTIAIDEFGHFSFLFNFDVNAVKRIFREFDVSGDAQLDFKEFRMFAMATIDKQIEMDEMRARKERQKRRKMMSAAHQRQGGEKLSIELKPLTMVQRVLAYMPCFNRITCCKKMAMGEDGSQVALVSQASMIKVPTSAAGNRRWAFWRDKCLKLKSHCTIL